MSNNECLLLTKQNLHFVNTTHNTTQYVFDTTMNKQTQKT